MAQNINQQQSSVRIIGGSLRNSKVYFTEADGLRPTSDRIRETLFNWLQNDIAGEDCLDLFAGSGAIAIESVSRGARSVVCIEDNLQVCKSIKDNLGRLGITNIELNHVDAGNWLTAKMPVKKKAGIVFIDPPFAEELIYQTCASLVKNGILKDHCNVYIESGSTINISQIPENWALKKEKKSGTVHYYLFSSGLPA